MTNQFTPEKAHLHALLKRTIITGFFGGIIWSVIWMVASSLNMVKIDPVAFWDKFFWENLPFDAWYMQIVAIGLYSLLSILFAVIYYVLFKRISHWLVGFLYGCFIWALFLFAIPFLFYQRVIATDYSQETLIGLCCLAVLYGLFIGFTISFDFKMLKIREKNDE